MALLDWTQYIVNTPTVEIENFTQIVGIGSLRQAGSEVLSTLVENNYTRGLTRGKIRDLIRIDTCTGGSDYDVGFFFMASQDDLTASGTCYTCSINCTSATANTKVELQYHSSGLSASPSVLFSSSSFDRDDSLGPLIIALELEWVYEPSLLNGVLITVREGHDSSLTDFSNLLEVGKIIVFEEDPFFIETSSSEGIYMDSRGSSGDLDIIRDSTRITELVPV
jgi:hypothetical protein